MKLAFGLQFDDLYARGGLLRLDEDVHLLEEIEVARWMIVWRDGERECLQIGVGRRAGVADAW